MTDERLFERLAAHAGPADVDAGFNERLYALLQQEMGRSRRSARPVLLLVAALLLALAIGGAVLVGSGLVELPVLPVLPDNSPPPTDLVWTEERATQDWPGALRVEPPGDAPPVDDWYTNSDPPGDVASGMAVADIVEVDARKGCWFAPSTCVYFEMAAEVSQPKPHPGGQWIAYGIVVDTTGDGHPDWRFGIDNAFQGLDHDRMWRTDLATGSTYWSVGILENPEVMDAVFPGDWGQPPPDPQVGFYPNSRTGSIFAKHLPGEQGFHFYVWASVIVDGQIVATDYAPDVGWIEVAP